ncbi:MAG: hypothetical protein IJ401_01680 [Oscillospiraceae bacterium]|nr:hypothetical protein [Oscillospiraceae bacterium]
MDIPIPLPRLWSENTNPAIITTLGEPCEPFGELSFFKMIDVFYDKAYALDEEGATSFILKGISELSELRAAVLACRRFDKPIIAILDIDSDTDETSGGKELGYLITLENLGLDAVGFSVIDESERSETLDVVRYIMGYIHIPLYIGLNENNAYLNNMKYFECIKNVVFDCSALSQSRVEAVKKYLSEMEFIADDIEDTSFVAANHLQAFFLNPEHITLSQPIDIECDMAEELIDFDDEVYDVIVVEINTHDDGFHLSQNLHWLELPVMFRTETEEALRMALCYYNGRALVDSTCEIDEENLKEICAEFGAILY